MGKTNEQKQPDPNKKLIKSEPKEMKPGQKILIEDNY